MKKRSRAYPIEIIAHTLCVVLALGMLILCSSRVNVPRSKKPASDDLLLFHYDRIYSINEDLDLLPLTTST